MDTGGARLYGEFHCGYGRIVIIIIILVLLLLLLMPLLLAGELRIWMLLIYSEGPCLGRYFVASSVELT
jgi:hypothetical protein